MLRAQHASALRATIAGCSLCGEASDEYWREFEDQGIEYARQKAAWYESMGMPVPASTLAVIESKASLGASAPLSSYCKRPFPDYAWTDEDYAALVKGAYALNVRPEDLLLVLTLESDLNPHAANCWPAGSYPNAIGLNQITKVSSDAMGISEAERLSLLDMTAGEQIPYVVRSFLAARGGKPFPEVPDVVTLYQTNIAPGTVPHEVIFTSPSTNYTANQGLDKNGDGKITRSDLKVVLDGVAKRDIYKNALDELQHGAGSTTKTAAKMIVGGIVLGGLSYLAYERGWFG